MDLFEVIEYYSNIGYKHISVPTMVEADVMNSTLPPSAILDKKPEGTKQLFHVASAEQSFIQMLKNGWKPKDIYYQAVSACHRPFDKNKGELYQEWFIKLELFFYNTSYLDLLSDALDLYSKDLFGDEDNSSKINVVHTNIGHDLIVENIEIGSYGARHINVGGKYFEFSYGTGYVPFRVQKVKEKLK